jgi:glycine/D-amino acid oxidase-like deaminating enzyme
VPDRSASERRYRERSLWLDGVDGELTPRPALAGDAECDVAIVGAGLTGLWTAYFLAEHAPDRRVAIVEREIAGFGPAGRNGGTVGGGIAGDERVYARRSGVEAVREAERTTNRAVDEIGEVLAREEISCGWRKGGWMRVATSPAQVARLDEAIGGRREWGAEDLVRLSRDEVRERVRVAGALGGLYSPHAARIDPARMVRGLAEAVERRGVAIHERTEALAIEPGRVRTRAGTLRATHVVRATEAFTVQLPGERRRFLPLYSLMVATERLGPDAWKSIGWTDPGLTLGDMAHLFFYAQRTADDRIAIGGRGAPYVLGSPIDERYERRPDVYRRLASTIRTRFPAAADAAITHHWGGPLAIPRDWCQAVRYDPVTRVGWGGGYSGSGNVSAYLAGRALADLVLGRDSEYTRLPWVGHESRRWEIEPLRFVASRAIVRIMRSADRAERHTAHTARRMALIRPFVAGH